MVQRLNIKQSKENIRTIIEIATEAKEYMRGSLYYDMESIIYYCKDLLVDFTIMDGIIEYMIEDHNKPF